MLYKFRPDADVYLENRNDLENFPEMFRLQERQVMFPNGSEKKFEVIPIGDSINEMENFLFFPRRTTEVKLVDQGKAAAGTLYLYTKSSISPEQLISLNNVLMIAYGMIIPVGLELLLP